jgi:hypothetical protein|mmetsp:Transcript_17155/g.37212  ORF Transcript_17155/g.37212 Transcript_17155/m.37212 type:complete len:130 (-) Transcript_17155:1915-2304(-)
MHRFVVQIVKFFFSLTVVLIVSADESYTSLPANNNFKGTLRGYVNADTDPVPTLSDCLISASSATECTVPGCVWCKEPIYGLCVTESTATKIGWMPFLTCEKVSGEDVEKTSRRGSTRVLIRPVPKKVV